MTAPGTGSPGIPGGPKRARAFVRLAAYAFVAVSVFGIAELGLSVAARIVGLGRFRGILYFPPDLTEAQYQRYLNNRDPVLGWPSPRQIGAGEFDASGARVSPAYPLPGGECVTLYGDSFTFGDEVETAQAWGNLLAQRLGCRVANFGVISYGSDQALLRFSRNPNDSSKVAVLGIYADNLLRNVNQYRYFLAGVVPLGLKPRFVLDGDTLRLVGIPDLTYDQMVAALRDPRAVWHDEEFLPGSSEGLIPWSFPYTLALMRVLGTSHGRDLLGRRPRWIDFAQPEHPSRALPTTVGIAEEFRRVATGRGKSTVVVLFTDGAGFDHFRHTGVSPFQPLTDALRARGIRALDLSQDFAAYLANRGFCELLKRPDVCSGHLTPEGNEVVANVLSHYILREKLLPGKQ